VGTRLSALIEQQGYGVRRAIRAPGGTIGDQIFPVGDLESFRDWPQLVSGADALVHLAARAHEIRRADDETASLVHAVNVDATLKLAAAAARSGVRRFVFLSSVGVNGNETKRKAFTETDRPSPAEVYAISKWEAEQKLAQIQAETGMQVTIVRPTLIYGAGAKGNVLRVLKTVASGLPLPFGALCNARSFIGLDNLCDLILRCVESPQAAGEVFLAAEPERHSTAEFFRCVAFAMGHRHQIWRWPSPLLRAAASIAGRQRDLHKLSSALEVNPAKAMNALGWRPNVSFCDGIAAMVEWFLAQRLRGRHV
jgi:nucleoside-diphosphate-sugar epimerase